MYIVGEFPTLLYSKNDRHHMNYIHGACGTHRIVITLPNKGETESRSAHQSGFVADAVCGVVEEKAAGAELHLIKGRFSALLLVEQEVVVKVQACHVGLPLLAVEPAEKREILRWRARSRNTLSLRSMSGTRKACTIKPMLIATINTAITSGCCGWGSSADSMVTAVELALLEMGPSKEGGSEHMVSIVLIVLRIVLCVDSEDEDKDIGNEEFKDVGVVGASDGNCSGAVKELRNCGVCRVVVLVFCFFRSLWFSASRLCSWLCSSSFCAMSPSISVSMLLWCFFFFSRDVAAAARFCARRRSFFSTSLRGRFEARLADDFVLDCFEDSLSLSEESV